MTATRRNRPRARWPIRLLTCDSSSPRHNGAGDFMKRRGISVAVALAVGAGAWRLIRPGRRAGAGARPSREHAAGRRPQ